MTARQTGGRIHLTCPQDATIQVNEIYYVCENEDHCSVAIPEQLARCNGRQNCIIEDLPLSEDNCGDECNSSDNLYVDFICKKVADLTLQPSPTVTMADHLPTTISVNDEDTEPPKATCPRNFTRFVPPEQDRVLVFWPDSPLFNDNSGVILKVDCTSHNGTELEIDVISVNCTAKDGSGNTNSCSFPINVTKEFCNEEAGTSGTWPRTMAGAVAESEERCPLNNTGRNMGRFLRNCTYSNATVGGVWEEEIPRDCGEFESVGLNDLFNITLTDDNVDDVTDAVTNAIEDSIQKDEDIDIADIQQAFTNIVEYGSSSPDVTEGIVNTLNTILSTNISSDDQESALASSQIIKSVEQQVAYTIEEHGEFHSVKPNVVVEGVSVSQAEFTGGVGFGVSQTDTGFGAGVTYDPEKMQTERPDVGSVIQLPNDALFENGKGDGAKVTFIAYNNSQLFKSQLNDTRVVGPILSAVVLDKNVTFLKEQVVIQIAPVKGDDIPTSVLNKTKCVYWDFSMRDGIGDWAEDGCELISAESRKITCHCNHLTNFAVLVYHGEKIIHSKPLDIVSKIGCYISLVALIVTIMTLILVRRLKNARGKTAQSDTGRNAHYFMIQLCGSLSGVYVVFLAAIEKRVPGTVPVSGCTVAAALLHYLVLATMVSTAVLARYFYTKLVTVLKDPGGEPNLIVKASAVTYGIPAIIVVVCLGVDHRRTGFKAYNNEHYCFPKVGWIVYFGVLLPIAIVLIHNLISAGWIIKKGIFRPRFPGARAGGNDSDKLILQLRQSTAISCVLGLSWIFGFFAIDEATLIFQWLFTIFNSLQGLLIFIFFCKMSSDDRATIITSMPCSCCRNYLNTASSRTETSNISRSNTTGKDEDRLSIDNIEMSKPQSP